MIYLIIIETSRIPGNVFDGVKGGEVKKKEKRANKDI